MDAATDESKKMKMLVVEIEDTAPFGVVFTTVTVSKEKAEVDAGMQALIGEKTMTLFRFRTASRYATNY